MYTCDDKWPPPGPDDYPPLPTDDAPPERTPLCK